MKQVYIARNNGKLSVSDGHLLHTDKEGVSNPIFPHLTSSIVAIGQLNLTAPALSLLMKNNINVFLNSQTGTYKGTLDFGDAKNIFLRQKQYALSLSSERSLLVAKEIVKGKIRNQLRFLQRLRNQGKDVSAATIEEIKYLKTKVQGTSSLEELRGLEGIAAALYFSGLRCNIPQWTGFEGRNRRPPQDPFNALLSMLYALLSNKVEAFLMVEGFDTALGTLHVPSYGRQSLVCDLMEEFRVPLGDTIACSMLNRRELSENDFEFSAEDGNTAVHLKEDSRKKAILQLEQKACEEVFYPPLGKTLSYEKIIHEQVKQYKAIVLGETDDYVPMYFK